jgi:hypothetical protein
MLRLKSRTQAPPGGFLYAQRQTAWQNWIVDPPSQWDFDRLCLALQAHRRANPRFKFSTNLALIQNEVDSENARRVAAIPGAADVYTVSDGTAVSFRQAPVQSSPLQQVAAVAGKLSTGAATIEDFLESGEAPASKETAESRAAICVQCPQNGKGDFTRWFTVPVANRIRNQLEAREKRGLRTSLDDKLGVCEACLCPMKLKVFFPIEFIIRHMSEEVKAQLNAAKPRCWILQEAKV